MRRRRWGKIYVYGQNSPRAGERYWPKGNDEEVELERNGELLSFPGNPWDLSQHAAARAKGGPFDRKVAKTLRNARRSQ
jgi:hypothetical protein